MMNLSDNEKYHSGNYNQKSGTTFNQTKYCFNGNILTGHDLNYFYQGAINNYYHHGPTRLISTIFAHTLWDYHRVPTRNEIGMALIGYLTTKDQYQGLQ